MNLIFQRIDLRQPEVHDAIEQLFADKGFKEKTKARAEGYQQERKSDHYKKYI